MSSVKCLIWGTDATDFLEKITNPMQSPQTGYDSVCAGGKYFLDPELLYK